MARAESHEIRDSMIPLIRVASRQIDATPGGRLGWVVQFVREDSEAWRPKDVEAHGHRLLALVYPPMPNNTLQLGSGKIPPVSPDAVRAIHRELGAWIRTLVTMPVGQLVPIPSDEYTEVLVRASEPGKKPASFGISRGGPRRTLLFQTMKALVLAPLGKRLLACPTCDEPYMAVPGKKRYCDGRCRQRWHDVRRPKKGVHDE